MVGRFVFVGVGVPQSGRGVVFPIRGDVFDGGTNVSCRQMSRAVDMQPRLCRQFRLQIVRGTNGSCRVVQSVKAVGAVDVHGGGRSFWIDANVQPLPGRTVNQPMDAVVPYTSITCQPTPGVQGGSCKISNIEKNVSI